MNSNTIDSILENKIIAIIRGYSANICIKIAEALYEGGIKLIEVTFNQADRESFMDTAQAIKAINERFCGDVLAGAGTVVTLEQLRIASDAQAQYIISPNVDSEIIKKTCEQCWALFKTWF